MRIVMTPYVDYEAPRYSVSGTAEWVFNYRCVENAFGIVAKGLLEYPEKVYAEKD